MTTNVPVDAGGNYYYPALVPTNATIQLPVTDIAPDPALGDRGLKFDWATNTWNTSEDDPTNKKIAELQQIIKGLTTSQLNMIADQTNTDTQEPAPAQGSQATQATQATHPVGSQSGVSSLSDMAGMLNNPDMAKKGDK